MKYTIYEDPITHRFGHLPLPSRFVEGDRLPPIVIERWFESHNAAVAALSELLSGEEVGSAATEETEQTTAVPQPIDPPHRPFWYQH